MPITKIVLYVKSVERTIAFYEKYFGFRAEQEEGDRIVELVSADGGVALMIHQAGKAQKLGQSQMKLVFDIEDVQAFSASCRKKGLVFGAAHRGEGYVFANARDPSGNPISVSSRAFRRIRR